MNYHLFEADELKLNLIFKEKEIETFQKLWQKNKTLLEISKQMHRHPSEIALLVFDHAERGLIKKRQRGIFGA